MTKDLKYLALPFSVQSQSDYVIHMHIAQVLHFPLKQYCFTVKVVIIDFIVRVAIILDERYPSTCGLLINHNNTMDIRN